MSITIGIGVFGLDVDISLSEGGIFVTSRGKIVGVVDVTSINHASIRESLTGETFFVRIREICKSLCEIALNKIGFVGPAVICGFLAGSKRSDDGADPTKENNREEQNDYQPKATAGAASKEYDDRQDNRDAERNQITVAKFFVISLTFSFYVFELH